MPVVYVVFSVCCGVCVIACALRALFDVCCVLVSCVFCGVSCRV